jgi:chitin synthase
VGSDDVFDRIWAFHSGTLWKLTDCVYTLGLQQGTSSKYNFFDPDVVSVFKEQPGQDITKSFNTVLDGKDLNSGN